MNFSSVVKLTSAFALLSGFAISGMAGVTANCFNTAKDLCGSDSTCFQNLVSTDLLCKQLCVPYIDPGCCQYTRTVVYYQDALGALTHCPCSDGFGGPGPFKTNITNANNVPDTVCKPSESGSPAGCSVEINGRCY